MRTAAKAHMPCFAPAAAGKAGPTHAPSAKARPAPRAPAVSAAPAVARAPATSPTRPTGKASAWARMKAGDDADAAMPNCHESTAAKSRKPRGNKATIVPGGTDCRKGESWRANHQRKGGRYKNHRRRGGRYNDCRRRQDDDRRRRGGPDPRAGSRRCGGVGWRCSGGAARRGMRRRIIYGRRRSRDRIGAGDPIRRIDRRRAPPPAVAIPAPDRGAPHQPTPTGYRQPQPRQP